MTFKRGLGLFLAVLGSLIPIGVALWFIADPLALWGVIATALIVSLVSNDQNRALLEGSVVLLCGALIAFAVFLTGNVMVLWALFGVALVVTHL